MDRWKQLNFRGITCNCTVKLPCLCVRDPFLKAYENEHKYEELWKTSILPTLFLVKWSISLFILKAWSVTWPSLCVTNRRRNPSQTKQASPLIFWQYYILLLNSFNVRLSFLFIVFFLPSVIRIYQLLVVWQNNYSLFPNFPNISYLRFSR